MITVPRDTVRGITPKQWSQLDAYLEQEPKMLMPHTLHVKAGFSILESIALFESFTVLGCGTHYVVGYHGCTETWVLDWEVGSNPPAFPMECSHCETKLLESHLKFGFVMRMHNYSPLRVSR